MDDFSGISRVILVCRIFDPSERARETDVDGTAPCRYFERIQEDRMTSICREQITHPSAWTSADLGGKSAITRNLSTDEIRAFDEVLARTRHLAPQAVSRSDFDHPTVCGLVAELRHVVMEGRGLILVSGLDPARYSPEDLERIYWGIGTHLGIPAVQSHAGDRLGRVEEDDGNALSRGYRSSSELHMHTDAYEMVGLMCIQKGATGGQSALVSSLAIHNEIVKTHPEYLDALYSGFHMALSEAQLSSKQVTDERIPVFCFVDNKVSCIYSGRFKHDAATKMGVDLPGNLREALAFIAKTAERDDLALRFMLEPGEFVLWHNFLNLHSRTRFENDATHKRLLLRLWLNVPDGRPVVKELYARGATYDRIFREHLARGAA